MYCLHGADGCCLNCCAWCWLDSQAEDPVVLHCPRVEVAELLRFLFQPAART